MQCRKRYSVNSSLSETGNVKSRLRYIGSPSRCSWVSSITLFWNVLECSWITLFLILRPSKVFLTIALLLTVEASLGCASGTDYGAVSAFEKEKTDLHSLLFLPFFFPFNLLFICVMWSRLILRRSVSNHWCSSLVCCENLFFSFSYCFHVFLLNSLCDFLEWSTYFPIICCIDTFFIDLNAASDQIFSLFINFFVKFVDVVFPSFCWPSIWSVTPIFLAEIWISFSSF